MSPDAGLDDRHIACVDRGRYLHLDATVAGQVLGADEAGIGPQSAGDGLDPQLVVDGLEAAVEVGVDAAADDQAAIGVGEIKLDPSIDTPVGRQGKARLVGQEKDVAGAGESEGA